MTNLTSKIFSRNIGLITEKEQKILQKSTVGIAGAGSDGGLLAERLVRFGVGKILLADPDVFEIHNINRQFMANFQTLGKSKARIIARELKKINPNLKIEVFPKGITKENVKRFVKESDVVVDEIDYLNPESSVILGREAKLQKKYVFMGASIGWAASIFCFAPYGMSFEEYFEYDERKKEINLLKYVKIPPTFFKKTLVKKILEKQTFVPFVSSSTALVAAFLASEIILFLLKKRKPICVPNFLYIDPFERKIEIR